MARSRIGHVILGVVLAGIVLPAPSAETATAFGRILIHFDDAPGGAWLPPDYYASRGVLFYSEAGGSGYLWNTPCPSVLDDPHGGAFSLPNAIAGDRIGYVGVRAYFVDPATGAASTTDYVNVGVSSGPGPDRLSPDVVLVAFDDLNNPIAVDSADSNLQYDYLTVSVPGISWVKMVAGYRKEIWDDFIFELPEELTSISGGKFYDSNVDGVWDPGEVGLACWLILLEGGVKVPDYSPAVVVSGTDDKPRSSFWGRAHSHPLRQGVYSLSVDSTYTDTGGYYGFIDLEPGAYVVREVIPEPQPVWVPTTLTEHSVTLQSGQNVTGIDFGNVALGEVGARTIGYWKNHLERITPGMYAALEVLPAFAGCGNPDSVLAILTPPWPDMAAKLRAQLLAMTLNVLSGIVAGDRVVYLGWDVLAAELLFGLPAPSFRRAQEVLDAVELAWDWGGWTRSEQQAVKDLLDRMNNDLLFVLPGLPSGDRLPPAFSGGTRSAGRYEAQSSTYHLFQNAPNPFSASTLIRYQLCASGHVSLEVYDLSGRLVRVLADGEKDAAIHSVKWNGTDSAGRRVKTGIYICRLAAGELTATSKMLVLYWGD